MVIENNFNRAVTLDSDFGLSGCGNELIEQTGEVINRHRVWKISYTSEGVAFDEK